MQNEPGTDEPLQWGSDAPATIGDQRSPVLSPLSSRAAKGTLNVHGLAQLCLARHASSQAGPEEAACLQASSETAG